MKESERRMDVCDMVSLLVGVFDGLYFLLISGPGTHKCIFGKL